MTPVVLKMETIQQKAQYQISNMVLARKNRGKGTGTASNAYKAHIILLMYFVWAKNFGTIIAI